MQEEFDVDSEDAPAAQCTSMKGSVVAVDYETFYDSAAKYSLRNMDPYSYVHDPRFDAYLVSIVSDLGEEYVGNPRGFDWASISGKQWLAHNAAFDGMVTNRLVELGIIPDVKREWLDTADLVSYLCVPRSLKDACRELLGLEISKKARSDMDGKKEADLTALQRHDLLNYAADDSRLCLRLWQEYGAQWPEIERKVSKANREAGWLGVHCDRAGIMDGLRTLKAIQAEAARGLPWYNPSLPLTDKNNRKPGSRPAFLMHAISLGLPVPTSIKKDDPGMLAWVAKYGKDHPFIQARLTYASVTPHIARLESMLELMDKNDVLRFSGLYFGAHCLTGDHEVLTRDGWVPLEKWQGGDIMQWRPNHTTDFLPATANSFANEEDYMVEIDSPWIRIRMTQGHTVPTFRHDKLVPRKANNILLRGRGATLLYHHDGLLKDDGSLCCSDGYLKPEYFRKAPADPVVYCPSTETGYFLVRYRGAISVTGNTGRSSGGHDSSDEGGGARWNFYNQSKGDRKTGLTHGVNMRGLVTARPGKVFGIWDFSQIEPRVAHWLAGNTEFLTLVEKEDMYQATAKMLGWYPKDRNDLKHEDPKTRDLSKACSIGQTYQMSGAKFALTCEKMGIPLTPLPESEWDLDRRAKFLLRNSANLDWEDPAQAHKVGVFLTADRIVQQWRRSNPKVCALWPALQGELEEAAHRQEPVHMFELPSGRPKPYYNPHFRSHFKIMKDAESGDEATVAENRLMASVIKGMQATPQYGGLLVENLVQATARDIMFWGAMDIIDTKPQWDYIGNVYDEVVFELPEDDAAEAEKLIPYCLCRGSSSSWTKGLPLAVDGGIRLRYEK